MFCPPAFCLASLVPTDFEFCHTQTPHSSPCHAPSVGLLFASFIISELARTFSAFRLIGVGMSVWTVGVVLTGAAPTFGVLILARIIVGAGKWASAEMQAT